jgi:hypothetical protein
VFQAKVLRHTRIISEHRPSLWAKLMRWKRGYFVKDEARASGAETMPEPRVVKAMVFIDLFVAGLRMPLHLALADILLHFQAQLHQLTPNAIAQLSRFF